MFLQIEIWRRRNRRRSTACEINQVDVRVQSDVQPPQNPTEERVRPTSVSPVNVEDIRVDIEGDGSPSIVSREEAQEIQLRRLSRTQRTQSLTVTLHNEMADEICPVVVNPVMSSNYGIL